MPDLDFTGERLIPSKSPSSLEAEHRARYEFAKTLVQDKRVLDLGCGEGYGSSILAEVAGSVMGLDISSDAINHAIEAYPKDNLDFMVGDVTRLPFSQSEFDACVCFEVMEHIQKPEELFGQVFKILGSDGIFIVSTPNGAVKVSSQPNPFHVKEHTLQEFSDFLGKCFPNPYWETTIYGQFIKGKTYSPLGRTLKNLYLTIKSALGMGKKASISQPIGPTPEYEFRTPGADLAEYLVAVVKKK